MAENRSSGARRHREARVTDRLELLAGAVAGLAAKVGGVGLAPLPPRRAAGHGGRPATHRPAPRRPARQRPTRRRPAA